MCAFLVGLLVVTGPLRSAQATPDGPSPPVGFVDRSGLSELVVWQGFNGLVAGSFLGTAVGAQALYDQCQTRYGAQMALSKPCKDAASRSSGIVVLGLASGIAVPLLVTNGRPVRTADALLVNRSTLIGAMHGFILPFAAGLEPNWEKGRIGETRALSALTFTGDLMGVGAGAYLAYHYNPAPGTVSFLGTLHSATFLAAMSIGNSLPDTVDRTDERIISGSALAAADAALAVGLVMLDRIDVGRNRVFWLDTGAFVGWLAGGGLGAALAGSDPRPIAIAGTVGMAAGLVLTYWATKNSEEWRVRHDPGGPKAAFHWQLDAPSLRIEPADQGSQRTVRVSLDAVRGRF